MTRAAWMVGLWLTACDGPSEPELTKTEAKISKAVAAGLTFRPLAETARDTLEWHKTRPESERDDRVPTPHDGTC